MNDLIRRAWWLRMVNGKRDYSRIHLFQQDDELWMHNGGISLCGRSVPWHLQPRFQPNGYQGGLIIDPGPEAEIPVCHRCEAIAARRKEQR